MRKPASMMAAALCYALSLAVASAQTISPPTIPALNDNGTIVSSRESIDVTSNAYVQEIANAGTTGTTLNKLAKLAGAPSAAIIAGTSDTTGDVIGIVIGGAGTTGNAQIAITGQASCVFDGAITSGHYVQVSTTAGGSCHDGGSTFPTSGQVIGVILANTNATPGSTPQAVTLFPPGILGTQACPALTGNVTSAAGSCATVIATGAVSFADIASAALATPSNYFSGAASVLVPASQIYQAEIAVAFSTTPTFDFSTFINASVTLTGNITTMSVANVKAGQAGQIRFIQDATGSRTTVWNSVFKFAGGVTPTLSTAANAIDVLFYSCISTSLCYASLAQNMK